jgi:hypothetical protein
MSCWDTLHKLFVVLTIIFFIVALAIPYWSVADVTFGTEKGKVFIGLWKACSNLDASKVCLPASLGTTTTTTIWSIFFFYLSLSSSSSSSSSWSSGFCPGLRLPARPLHVVWHAVQHLGRLQPRLPRALRAQQSLGIVSARLALLHGGDLLLHRLEELPQAAREPGPCPDLLRHLPWALKIKKRKKEKKKKKRQERKDFSWMFTFSRFSFSSFSSFL